MLTKWQTTCKFNLKQEMVIFGDFQRDKASQIGAHSIIFSSAPAEKTALQIGMHGVNREHPCGSTGTLQFPITT